MELFGDIGGEFGFLFAIAAPIITLLMGDRYSYSLFKRIFWVNETDPDEDKHPNRKQRINAWNESTKKFDISYR